MVIERTHAPSTLLLIRIAWNAQAALGEDWRERGAQAAAAVLKPLVPERAVLARYADDVFAIRLDGNRSRPAQTLARRILAAFEPPVPAPDGEEMCGTPVIGIAAGGRDAAAQARDAELALEHARATGASVQVFDEEIARARDRRAIIERNLRHAIIDGRVGVMFQPIVSLRTTDVVGAEALMRWDCPGLGPVAPSEFIAIADESRAILRLGEWILREACAQNRRWQLAGLPHVRVSVNVAPRQVAQRDFLGILGSVTSGTSLAPEDLEIELTGTAAISREESSRRTLQAVRRLGVTVAVDEFGGGYSSIGDLATLPAETLKLDRGFVQDLGSDRFKTQAARAIVELAHLQGMRVVAVGVETAEQAAVLRAMDCDEAQGFLLGAPADAAAFAARLERERLRASIVPNGSV